MQQEHQIQPRKEWESPQFTIYGSVEEITECDKWFGSSDGHTLAQVPIHCVS
jgi:hypothetical protein